MSRKNLYALNRLGIIAAYITLITFMISANAELLKDPTLPPASVSNSAIEGNQPLESEPKLQSVIIGPHLHAAIISGQKVLLGEKYAQSKLIKLNDHEAILRNSDMTTKVLTMDYGSEKSILSAIKIVDGKKISRPPKSND